MARDAFVIGAMICGLAGVGCGDDGGIGDTGVTDSSAPDGSPDGAPTDSAMTDSDVVCIPVTCADLAASCGDPSDGCGGTLSCGTCETDFTCVEEVCVEDLPDECGGAPMNACGGCSTLTFEPAASCPCAGSVAACVVEPWPLGVVFCDDGDNRGADPVVLPATDDDVDEFSETMGSFDIIPAEDASGGHFDQDIDTFQVPVEDTTLGRFEPEIEYVHPGGFSGEICVSHYADELDDLTTLECPPEARREGFDVCCVSFPEDPTTISFQVELFVSLFDDSGDFNIGITSYGGPTTCAAYTLRYRF
jgi:hypothetical protein